ncbi:MAG TPA: serine/threonine protein kinase [Deltaproteobacteria bacterium]|nr:serine/threonine protein kinase [Deltaproteobacteria bacterium]
MQQIIDDRYRLDRELGTGGTATVWMAHDLVLDRICAVKLLLPVQGAHADERRARLRSEARTLASLEHKHIVRVWDQGQHGDRDYLVMEYVEGGSLEDRLALEGPLAPTLATRLILQVLEALSAAHGAGVVHRDVKPGNVLLRSATEAALCDFGIARQLDGGGATQTGMALGSVGYMAPEQRIDARRVGPPADLYATACTLFNLVTGDTPVDLYLAPDHSPRWGGVPSPLRPVLRQATRAEIDHRYQSAAEMASALQSVIGALAELPAQRRRAPIGGDYVPTVVPGTSPPLTLEASSSSRSVGVDDWRRSGRHPPGRMALWIGVGLVGSITALGLAAGPLLEDLQQRADLRGGSSPLSEASAAPEPPGPVALSGRWRGNLEGSHRMRLDLRGPDSALVGEIVLGLGNHERRSRVTGWWDAERRELVLEEPDRSTYRASPGPVPGILVGELRRAPLELTLPFALVWVGGEE